MAPDHLGFESRRPASASESDAEKRYERHLFVDRLLKGSTLQAKYVSDLIRAVDALCGLPQIDAGRLGVCGHSLGGQESMWLAWADMRLRVMCSSCGFGLIEILQRQRINHNFAMYLPGLLRKGDIDDVLCSLCPKPVFLGYGTDDPILPQEAVKPLTERAERVYRQAGAVERCLVRYYKTGHDFADAMQDDMLKFITEHLR